MKLTKPMSSRLSLVRLNMNAALYYNGIIKEAVFLTDCQIMVTRDIILKKEVWERRSHTK